MESSSYQSKNSCLSKPIPINYSNTNNNNFPNYPNSNISTTSSIPIPVSNNQSTEYCLKQNFFDPTKNSPPDNFMEKLEVRMQHYYNTHSFKQEESCNIAYFTK